MSSMDGISKAPVYASDRSALRGRTCFDFRDYGFEISPGLTEVFEVVPTQVTDQECFLFFFSREDVSNNRWAMFNLHVFLKKVGAIEDFAHSLGPSVQSIALSPVTVFHKPGLGYSRQISMGDLFKGAESVITFIGGEPSRVVRDSHYYFAHHHNHCYTGLLHAPGEEVKYDTLRGVLFDLVRFVD